MSRTCVIIAGGSIGSELKSLPENPYIICADKGYDTAKEHGLKADMILGDFDSLGYVPKLSGVKIYPSAKDDTDTMLAVKHALEEGMNDIRIYGALGGRLDHTIAALQTLKYISDHGGNGLLIDENTRVCMQTSGEEKQYRYRHGMYFSVFAYGGSCTGVTISGTEYTLENAELNDSFPLGVSNRIKAEYARVSVGKGCLLIVQAAE